jgi:rhodanese-related sulfurtransferase
MVPRDLDPGALASDAQGEVLMHQPKRRNRIMAEAPKSAVIAGLLALLLFAGGYAAGREQTPGGPYIGPLQQVAQPLPGDIGLVTPAQVVNADPDSYVMVDVRGRDAFDFAHAVGAISMPESEMVEVAPTLPADKTLVIYCTCPDDKTSLRAARTLVGVFHIPNVVVLHEGLIGFKDAGGALSSDASSSAIEHKGCGCGTNAEAFKLWAIDKATHPEAIEFAPERLTPFQ